MKDITEDFGTLYQPTSALVFYQSYDRTQDTYVEHFDMDKDGNPIFREDGKLLKSDQYVPPDLVTVYNTTSFKHTQD